MNLQKKQSKLSTSLPNGFKNTFGPNSWIEISSSAVAHNINQYRKVIAPHIILAPVIKANAYGHGMLEIAKLLDGNPVIKLICVAKLSEAIRLRKNGFKKQILVLSIIDAQPASAIQLNISVAIWDVRTAEKFNAIAASLGKKALLHLKIDTGLSRMGPLYNEAFKFTQTCTQLKNCVVQGLFTHFANSESHDPTFAQLQIERLTTVLEKLKKHSITPPLIHCASSAAIPTLPQSHLTMTRLGVGLYGLWPSAANKNQTEKIHPSFTLRPVLEWKTRINMIKTIPTGSYVGYDLTFKTKRLTQIAVLPVGYADGYNRLLSNKGTVKIKNQYAPVIGRVAMNLTMVDITEIENVTPFDEVTLLGNDPKINAEEMARLCLTINYDIVTNIDSTLSCRVVS